MPARERLRAGGGACGSSVSASGSSNTNVAPCPGSDSTASVPPFASVNPLAIASPNPEPPWSVGPAAR